MILKQPANCILVPGKLLPHALDRLEENFDVVRIERSNPDLLDRETAGKISGIAAMTVVDARLIDALPALEIIANFGVGCGAGVAKHAAAQGVMVTNTPDVLTEEAADLAVGLLINTVRELPKAEAWRRAGRWAAEGPYRLTKATLRGRSVGIFG